MKKLSTILFLLSCITCFATRPALDTIVQNKIFKLGNLKVSNSGRWSGVTKNYKKSRDTMLLFDKQNQSEMPLKVKNRISTEFLGDDSFVSSNSDEMEIINLKSHTRKTIYNLMQTGVLSDIGMFFTLNKDKTCFIYDHRGNVIQKIPNIKEVLTDNRKIIFGIVEKGDDYQLINLRDPKLKTVYNSNHFIKRPSFTRTGKYLVLTEVKRKTNEIIVSALHVQDGSLNKLFSGVGASFVRADVGEVPYNDDLWIDIYSQSQEKKFNPDIWYGNDSDLREKKQKYSIMHNYFLFIEKEKKIMTFNTDRFTLFTPTNKSNYFLALNPRQNFVYDTRVPMPSIFLYDSKKYSFQKIFDDSREVIISPNGNQLLSYNHKRKKWILYSIDTNRGIDIDGEGLENPVYDNLGQHLYFESNKGIWDYNCLTSKIKLVKETINKSASIINKQNYLYDTTYFIGFNTLSDHKKIRLKVYDTDNKVVYFEKRMDKIKVLIPKTQNNIVLSKISNNTEMVYSIEENYNFPPKLFGYDVFKKEKKTVYIGSHADSAASLIKQEIVAYKNSENDSLKGVLFYPLNFDKKKKYPMIVQIYQKISGKANTYNIGCDGAGFNLRMLLEQGFFVFQPDILFSKKGTGLSALECVNNALDALNNNENIKWDKIGLVGHSMGGYETNFIATHSKRFAAYIAGSAHSDIIRAYFSYNYDNNIPVIWQFENGQYNMGVSFADNKSLYFENNPIHYVENVSAPILLWTGLLDENVRWDHTMEFYIGLKRNRKDVVALFYPNVNHILMEGQKEKNDLCRKTMEWWNYFLKDDRSAGWITLQMKKK